MKDLLRILLVIIVTSCSNNDENNSLDEDLIKNLCRKGGFEFLSLTNKDELSEMNILINENQISSNYLFSMYGDLVYSDLLKFNKTNQPDSLKFKFWNVDSSNVYNEIIFKRKKQEFLTRDVEIMKYVINNLNKNEILELSKGLRFSYNFISASCNKELITYKRDNDFHFLIYCLLKEYKLDINSKSKTLLEIGKFHVDEFPQLYKQPELIKFKIDYLLKLAPKKVKGIPRGEWCEEGLFY